MNLEAQSGTISARRRSVAAIVVVFLSLSTVGLSSAAVGVPSPGATRQHVTAQWTLQKALNPSSTNSTLLSGVSCTSATNCVAVGNGTSSVSAGQSIAERWNGKSWYMLAVAQHAPGVIGDALRAVSCTSSTWCVAVGDAIKPPSMTVPLAESWNGKVWTLQKALNPSSTNSTLLSGVSCTSATNCVAVGNGTSSVSAGQSIAERWNGKSWYMLAVAQHAPGVIGDALQAVSCRTATWCIAIGNAITPVGKSSLAERWNGKTWSIQTTPNPSGSSASVLRAEWCVSTIACSAVGSQAHASLTAPLAERYG